MTLEYNGRSITKSKAAFMHAFRGARNKTRLIYTEADPRQNLEFQPIQLPLLKNRAAVTAVAKRWIGEGTLTYLTRILFTPHRPIGMGHNYPKGECLALALLGEMEYQENKTLELALAKRTYEAPGLSERLDTVIKKLKEKYEEVTGRNMYNDVGKWGGPYWWYYGGLKTSFRHAFREPEKYSVGAKVSVIHDLHDLYQLRDQDTSYTIPAEILRVPDDKSRSSILNITDLPLTLEGVGTEFMRHADRQFAELDENPSRFRLRRHLRERVKGWRYPDGTLNEWNSSVKMARYLKRQIVWGPSFTTARMMQKVHASGIEAGSKEMEALTWAIFAFWQTKYRRSVSGIHTYYSVRDMGRNYGVDFDPLAPIPENPPDFRKTQDEIEEEEAVEEEEVVEEE